MNSIEWGVFPKNVDLIKFKYSHKILESLSKCRETIFKEHKKENRFNKTRYIALELVNLGESITRDIPSGCDVRVKNYKVYAKPFAEEEWKSTEKKKELAEKILVSKEKFVNKQWLYDIHWYSDCDYIKKDEDEEKHTQFMTESVHLIAECEWGYSKREIGYDFQKLLLGNAELRLFIFRTRNRKFLDEKEYDFEKSIKNYKLLCKGDKFLLCCFNEESKELLFKEIEKG